MDHKPARQYYICTTEPLSLTLDKILENGGKSNEVKYQVMMEMILNFCTAPRSRIDIQIYLGLKNKNHFITRSQEKLRL